MENCARYNVFWRLSHFETVPTTTLFAVVQPSLNETPINSNIVHMDDRNRIAAFLQRNTPVHIYAIGDLDDPYWPHTAWHAAEQDGEIRDICLIYTQFSPQALIALCGRDNVPMPDLLEEILPQLPDRLYSHLSPGLEDTVENHYLIESNQAHYKMYLTDRSMLAGVDVSRVAGLGEDMGETLDAFYPLAYGDTVEGGQVFDHSMPATGQYFGIWEGNRLVSAAGVHVLSPGRGVAALANIATMPGFRGRGFATATTTRLSSSLLEHVEHLGLNVRADNIPAIRCYQRLGYEIVASYNECSLAKRTA